MSVNTDSSSSSGDTMLDITRKMMLSYLPGDHHDYDIVSSSRYDHISWLETNSTPMVTDWSQFPGFSFAFPFESAFPRERARTWMFHNWNVSLAFSAGKLLS